MLATKSRLASMVGGMGRGKAAIITLLALVLGCQLYIMHVWLGGGGGSGGGSMSDIAFSRQSTTKCSGPLDPNAPPSLERAQLAMSVLRKYLAASSLPQPAAALPPPVEDLRYNVKPHDGMHVELGPHKHQGGGHHAGARDEVIHAHEFGEQAHSQAFLKQHSSLYAQMRLNYSLAWATDQLNPNLHHSLDIATEARMELCMDWWRRYKVEIEVGWGELPTELYGPFDDKGCSEVISLYQTARFIQNYTHLYDRVWEVDPKREIPVPTAPNTHKQVIAIIVSMTTRGLQLKNIVEDLVLFKNLFPSLLKTVEPGFEYWFYLGYDKGDPILDNASNLAIIREWFQKNVAAVALERSIVMKIVFSSWFNPYKKPGPSFNYVCTVAAADGAEFVYRINDDQIFETPWAKAMTAAVLEFGYPYGVVGPTCKQGAQHILVVDFVHRTHYDIFPTHYPPSLMAWWMDNWVSNIYGRSRTKRLSDVTITHLMDSHGTRYQGMFQIAQFLRGEKIRSRGMMELFLAHTPGMEKVLEVYKKESREKYDV